MAECLKNHFARIVMSDKVFSFNEDLKCIAEKVVVYAKANNLCEVIVKQEQETAHMMLQILASIFKEKLDDVFVFRKVIE